MANGTIKLAHKTHHSVKVIFAHLLSLHFSLPAWVWVVPGITANIGMVGLAPIFAYNSFKEITIHQSSAAGLLSIGSYVCGGCAMYLTLFISLHTFYLEGMFILIMALIVRRPIMQFNLSTH